jgi:hypothetical protein
MNPWAVTPLFLLTLLSACMQPATNAPGQGDQVELCGGKLACDLEKNVWLFTLDIEASSDGPQGDYQKRQWELPLDYEEGPDGLVSHNVRDLWSVQEGDLLVIARVHTTSAAEDVRDTFLAIEERSHTLHINPGFGDFAFVGLSPTYANAFFGPFQPGSQSVVLPKETERTFDQDYVVRRPFWDDSSKTIDNVDMTYHAVIHLEYRGEIMFRLDDDVRALAHDDPTSFSEVQNKWRRDFEPSARLGQREPV